MKIITNPDREFAAEVKKALKANNNYCPSALVKNKDTKCMWACMCGLYIKIEEDESND